MIEKDPKLAELYQLVSASLTDEQKKKADACKTANELMNLLSEEDIPLPDELLDMAVGGMAVVYNDRFGPGGGRKESPLRINGDGKLKDPTGIITL